MTFRKYLSHALVILSSMFVVFFALDIRNPAMAWIDNRITKTLLIIFAVASMTLAINTLKGIRRYEQRQAERLRSNAPERQLRYSMPERQLRSNVPERERSLQKRSYR
ncbi:hypothetical protein FACS1894184_05350 [Clostridia bacterium]|nr:hypothetical protein FACS1894184_05350 [Clostridia bacterium]